MLVDRVAGQFLRIGEHRIGRDRLDLIAVVAVRDQILLALDDLVEAIAAIAKAATATQNLLPSLKLPPIAFWPGPRCHLGSQWGQRLRKSERQSCKNGPGSSQSNLRAL